MVKIIIQVYEVILFAGKSFTIQNFDSVSQLNLVQFKQSNFIPSRKWFCSYPLSLTSLWDLQRIWDLPPLLVRKLAPVTVVFLHTRYLCSCCSKYWVSICWVIIISYDHAFSKFLIGQVRERFKLQGFELEGFELEIEVPLYSQVWLCPMQNGYCMLINFCNPGFSVVAI